MPSAPEHLEAATGAAPQAETIADATLRRGFLHHISHHTEIIAAWAARPGGGARPRDSIAPT